MSGNLSNNTDISFYPFSPMQGTDITACCTELIMGKNCTV